MPMSNKDKIHILISGSSNSGKGIIKILIADFLRIGGYVITNGDEDFSLIVESYNNYISEGTKVVEE